jgi:hypothetical protein
MMARSDLLPDGVQMGLVLDRYQEIMHLPEAAFNGLRKTNDDDCHECNAVWRQTDRDALAAAIMNAEEMREHELGYFVAPKYVENEEYTYKYPLILDRRYLISIGRRKTSDIQSGVALNHGVETAPNDPVSIVVPTTVTDTSEIHVYYPGESVEIRPSKVAISGGNATILIPRSRLVDPDVDTNCDPAPSYYENDNFLTTVDVKRVYYDVSEGVYLVWFNDCCSLFSIPSLTEYTQLAYPRIVDNKLAIVKPYAATYNAGTWTSASFAKPVYPETIRISYLSGRQKSAQVEIDTARLAHTLLPGLIPDRVDLCSDCWKADMEQDPSELVTPYGTARGAIQVWMSDSRAKLAYGGKFPSIV